MTTFIFARHGKSQANQDNIIAGPDSPLTKEGEAQSRKLGRSLKKQYIITTIVSSPLLRARHTAEIIAKQLHLKKDIEIIDDLRERGFGELTGGPKSHETSWYFTADGVSDIEPRGILIARAEAALSKIKKIAEAEEGDVLVVAHATLGFYLMQVASGKRYFEQFDSPKQPGNATAQKVEIAPVRSKPVEVKPKLLASAVAIVIGLALLVTGLVMLVHRKPAPDPGVKQQNIPLAPEDYNDNPNLQNAIQKQLQQQNNSAQAGNNAGPQLQPVQGISQ